MTTASKTRLLVNGKNDIAISSRSTDFNVQISAVNIHSRCSQMFVQNYKFNLIFCYFSSLYFLKTTYGHSTIICFLCDQTHGRNNKLPMKIIIFFFE